MMNNKNQNKKNVCTIYEIISSHYYDFKAIAERETKRFNAYNKDLDEDIFHNVLLAMADALGNNNFLVSLKDAKGYFCNSFKNALCRETLYARNKYKHDSEFEECMFMTKEGELDTSIDYDSIMADVEKQYGKSECAIFEEFISGYKLRELNEKWQINNSDYIVRKIKTYIKTNYSEINIRRKNK